MDRNPSKDHSSKFISLKNATQRIPHFYGHCVLVCCKLRLKQRSFFQAFLTVFPSIFAVMIARGAETPTKINSKSSNPLLSELGIAWTHQNHCGSSIKPPQTMAARPRKRRPLLNAIGAGNPKRRAIFDGSYLCHLVELSNGWVFGSEKKDGSR